MSIEQQFGPLKVVGIALRTTMQDGREQAEIPAHWERFHKEGIIEKIPNKIYRYPVAVYTDYEGDYSQPYTYILGCLVFAVSVPKGMVSVTLPKRRYAHYEIVGKFPDRLAQTWDTIRMFPPDRSYTADLEVYPADLNPENARVDLYLALAESRKEEGLQEEAPLQSH